MSKVITDDSYDPRKPFDTPEVLAQRRNVFARLARLSVKETQRRRLAALKEDPNSDDNSTTNHWLTGQAQTLHNANQLAYAVPYQAEYQASTPSTSREHSSSSGLDELAQQAAAQEEESNCAGSVVSDRDSVRSLPNFRGRLAALRRVGAPSLGHGIDKTSTVMTPSEVAADDFNSTLSIEQLRKEYYSGYQISKSLPIYANRSYLINSINSYSVVIIEGATGCGKTTQVPTYILEDAILEGRQSKPPMIYVTQPRRIAARSIANRVCDEHGWPVGSIVGYQVGLEKKVGPDTVLVFCTSGVLLQKLIADKSLRGYTHIIIDEAHERDADTDLLLMMIRKLMKEEMSFFRLIVMSATMDLISLKKYFTFKTNYGHRATTSPSVCKIGQEKQPSSIQVHYFERLRHTFGVAEPMPEFDLDEPKLHEECLKAAVKIILDVIPHLDTFSEATKSTLVFLPGMAEINVLHRMLLGTIQPIDIIPLHSCLSNLDQVRVFQPSPDGYRKVILATNIAESSITVKDAGFIIDFCLTKVLKKDPITKFPTLKLEWCTVDKCTQRSGRTGRCCPGKVFRMVSQDFFKKFKEYAEPELLTAPLELSVLRVKHFDMGEVQALLAVVMDPPEAQDIRTAILELKQIGALSSTYLGKLSDIDGDLTELGQVIVALPIDVHLSKLVAIAAVLDVLEDAIIVAACLSTNRTVIRHHGKYGNQLAGYKNKLSWANGSHSDLFVSLDVFKEYIYYKDEQGKDQRWLDGFCHNRDLDEKKLHEVSHLVEEIKKRLEHINIRVVDQPNRERNKSEDELFLKIAFCAAFYPNYFLTQELDEQIVQRELCGLDPTSTVICHNIPLNQVPLYRSQIMQQLTDNGVVANPANVDYVADVSKALLVFNEDRKMKEDRSTLDVIGEDGVIERSKDIKLSVFMAIKSADCKDFLVKEYREDVAVSRMKYYKDQREMLARKYPQRLLPSWIKLVTDREADNSRFEDPDNNPITDNYYLEIPFNVAQDEADTAEIYSVEATNQKLREEADKPGAEVREPAFVESDVFKGGYRRVMGPYSPISMKFRSVLEKSKGYNVLVDHQSVNCILLDPDYEKKRRQMLVAASVCQAKGKIMARDTTLMPNIRGLPTLMALLFAQYYRVVYNENMKCLAGAIFGLGWDENDEPIDKEYEVELNFDVLINKDDIGLINKARTAISSLVRMFEVRDPGYPRAELQQRLRQMILALVKKRRCPLNEVSISTINWEECEFVKDRHNVPKDQLRELNKGEVRIFLPVMESTKIFTEADMYKAVRENLKFLAAIDAYGEKPPMGGVRCLLCGSGQGFLFVIRSQILKHVRSEAHLEKLRQFEVFNKSG